MTKISICIPAYNRADKLNPLLDSIFNQSYPNVEVIICEDNSPERFRIRKIIEDRNERRIKYYENNMNLGYDANLRESIQRATGNYVVLMGNDDLMYPESLFTISNKIKKYNPSVIVRSYESFYKTEDRFYQVHKYVAQDTVINSNKNVDELAWLFYRVVLVSGLVIDANLAKSYKTTLVDGTLYYQNYLITRIANESNKPVLYIPEIIVKNRLVDAGDFGSSEIEKKGAWVPGERSIDSSIYQMKKFFECAASLNHSAGINISPKLIKIASAYSYPLLAYHSDKYLISYIQYVKNLRKIGYCGIYFYIYAISLAVFGNKISSMVISLLKKIFGHTIRLI
jgi:glycosyltransferase involved in cell wall biosynthesis